MKRQHKIKIECEHTWRKKMIKRREDLKGAECEVQRRSICGPNEELIHEKHEAAVLLPWDWKLA
jgi:hypothetical protein